MTTKTAAPIATIHMDKDQHDAMVQLQKWLNEQPGWFELSERQIDCISEVEQDAIEASSCCEQWRDDFFMGFDLNDDGALVATFQIEQEDGKWQEQTVLVLPR